MDEDNVNLSWFLVLMVAVGILEAYVEGVPWYIGGALGVVLYLFGFFGLIPVVGQVLYLLVANWFIGHLGLSVMPWIFWLGFANSVVVSIVLVVVYVISSREAY